MTKRTKKAIWIVAGVALLFAGLFLCVVFLNPFHRHEHCIKNAGLALRIYSTDHDGRFPYDTNGFGNALLLLVKDGGLGPVADGWAARYVTAPGDDGAAFKEALRTGGIIPEEKCSRIYVQGLSETNNPGIAILFDRKPTRGGDHGRRPWGPFMREVCFADGSMMVIQEEKWAAFAKNQIELLVGDGMERALAERYYGMR